MQVITGRTSDTAGFRRQMERWRAEVKPGAIGFEGSVAGITDDGTVVCVARFRDAKAAQANGERPEQTAWWTETSTYFDGEPTFRESTEMRPLLGGPSTAAGFVQVMDGVVPDRAKAEETETPELLAELQAARPDLLGGLRAWFDGGAYVDVAYFTSEAEARAGEVTPEFTVPVEQLNAVFGEVRFLDLRDPLLD